MLVRGPEFGSPVLVTRRNGPSARGRTQRLVECQELTVDGDREGQIRCVVGGQPMTLGEVERR